MGAPTMQMGEFRHGSAARDCVHCGLCLTACPTYLELGTEADSPRGRIYLIQKLADGEIGLDPNVTRHIDLCLGCRACESACPSGVRYGQVLEDARVAVRQAGSQPLRTRFVQAAVALFFTRPRLLALALTPVRWLEGVGLAATLRRRSRWFRLLPRLRRAATLSGATFAAAGEQRGRVALFEGCVARVVFAGTNEATVRVLARNGCEVVVPREQGCCGALLAHTGDRQAARACARRNVDGFGSGDEPIIVNAAGCGAMLREYGDLLEDDPAYAERARRLAARIRDVSEFLAGLGLRPPAGHIRARAVYHDACHLAHAQGVRLQPRALIRQIPGIELVDFDDAEICCGAAGSYNLSETAMAERLGARKARALGASGATIVATGNPGCVMQIRAALETAGIPAEVLHPIELLDRAYAAEPAPPPLSSPRTHAR